MKPTIYQILQRPIVTEKSFAEQAASNTYMFEVHLKASKDDVRLAVEKLFDVSVADVRTLVVRGKSKRFGRRLGKRPNWKKAYIQLKPGQSLPVFEGQ